MSVNLVKMDYKVRYMALYVHSGTDSDVGEVAVYQLGSKLFNIKMELGQKNAAFLAGIFYKTIPNWSFMNISENG